MRRDPQRLSDYLGDILEAIERIEEYVAHLDEMGFLSNKLVQDAVVRNFEIIGEAMTRLRREFPAVAAEIPELREVIDFRNLLSHGYDSVDLRVVWSLARHELPALLSALRGIVAGLGME